MRTPDDDVKEFWGRAAEYPGRDVMVPGRSGAGVGEAGVIHTSSAQKLSALREHALIESAISSNRIEGVEVEPARIGTIVFGKSLLRDRDEEEVRGYRQALDLIHTQRARLPVSEETIRRLHSLSCGGGDAGEYKQKENDIIEVYPDGRRTVRFRTLRARYVCRHARVGATF